MLMHIMYSLPVSRVRLFQNHGNSYLPQFSVVSVIGVLSKIALEF